MKKAGSSSGEAELRDALFAAAKYLADAGLNRGTTGNVSVRTGNERADSFLITPSGFDPYDMTADAMVQVNFSGDFTGSAAPSTEWMIHRDILMNRPEINAVVHTHSPFASTLACMSLDIPPFHYMIAVAGGASVRCAPYALFGSRELSENALIALKDRYACLLAHHGLIAIGADLKQALSIALELESLCEQYWRVLQIGTPVLLSEEQMSAVLDRFKTYGRPKNK